MGLYLLTKNWGDIVLAVRASSREKALERLGIKEDSFGLLTPSDEAREKYDLPRATFDFESDDDSITLNEVELIQA